MKFNLTDKEFVKEIMTERLCEDCDVSESTILYICKVGICIHFAHLCDDCTKEFKQFKMIVDMEEYVRKGFN
jgi:hypothetical protein